MRRATLGLGAGAHAMATLAAAAAFVALPTSQAHAQSVVSVCTGASLPRSVVTDITGQVVAPLLTPIQNGLAGVGQILGVPLSVTLSNSLTSAAAGNPIGLNVIGVDGNAINLATNPKCVTQSDSFTLKTPAGLAFGGNQITGLGTAGRTALANEANAIAIGDLSRTAVGSTGAVAIGDSAQVTAQGALGSVALGQNSLANGATLGNQAYLVGGTAAAEVNIGDRRLTGVAGGSADTDAVNVAQLRLAASGLAGNSLNYDPVISAFNAQRGGVAQRITNVAAGTLGAASTDAVNGAQLGATNDAVASNTTNIANLGGSVSTLTNNVATLQSDALLYDPALQAFNASYRGAPQRITNVVAGVIGAASSDAVNGAQLFGLGNSVATSLGGSSRYDPATGQLTAGISYGGTTYATVQGAVSAIETSVSGATAGMDTRYFNANSTMADSRAVGTDSTAIGPNALANADGSIAAGRNTSAMSAGSVAIGDGASTLTGKAVSIGAANIASGSGAVSIGDPNIAMGDGAVALGRDNQATGVGAVALGDTNFATGDAAVGIGQNNNAIGAGAVSIGNANALNGMNALAIGSSNTVNGAEALAVGSNNRLTGDQTLAFGNNIRTSGSDTLAIGNDTAATGDSSTALGNRAGATGLQSTALGTSAIASASYTTAVGQTATAGGYASTALGTGATASNLASTAIGAGASATAANSVALGGAASAARGALVGYSAFGLGAPQTTIGEIAVARTVVFPDPVTGLPQLPGERQITGVGAGSEATDAVNVAQLRGVSSTLGTAFVTSLGGGAAYNAVTGAVTGPAYVINGATYTNVGDALAGVSGQVGQAANAAVTYDTAAKTVVTLAGAGGTTLTNVTAATLTATSTDAVNGGQLFATNQQVSANTNAIANLSNAIAGSTVSPVQYSNPGTPTTANGGTVTNDVTLVGANAAAPVALHNVAAGSIALGSTDAVNGGQVAALAAASANAVQYDRNADGSRADVATLVGGTPGAAVRVTNVANGALGATSTDAVNGQQLFAVSQTAQTAQTTAQTAQTSANAAGVVAANSVQYDVGRASVSLGAANGSPVGLHNVAAGTLATDAVNVGQLNAGIDRAITTSNAYTDTRIGQISYDLSKLRRDAEGGTAAAMALSTIPQAYGPGMGMVGMGVSTWQGESAIAVGASKATADGRIVFKAGATYNTRGQGGAAGGVGFGF